jgi:hypothetical protein
VRTRPPPDAAQTAFTESTILFADDKATHDRLHAAATEFVEKYARTFSSGGSGSGATAQSEWQLVEGQPRHLFTASGEGDGRVRPYTCTLVWSDCFSPGCAPERLSGAACCFFFLYGAPKQQGAIEGASAR